MISGACCRNLWRILQINSVPSFLQHLSTMMVRYDSLYEHISRMNRASAANIYYEKILASILRIICFENIPNVLKDPCCYLKEIVSNKHIQGTHGWTKQQTYYIIFAFLFPPLAPDGWPHRLTHIPLPYHWGEASSWLWDWWNSPQVPQPILLRCEIVNLDFGVHSGCIHSSVYVDLSWYHPWLPENLGNSKWRRLASRW